MESTVSLSDYASSTTDGITYTDTTLTNCNPWWTPNYYYVQTYTYPKIQLNMDEANALIKAAKSDKKIGEALKKLAPHIEVKVNWP